MAFKMKEWILVQFLLGQHLTFDVCILRRGTWRGFVHNSSGRAPQDGPGGQD
jgi:hypothetical protein